MEVVTSAPKIEVLAAPPKKVNHDVRSGETVNVDDPLWRWSTGIAQQSKWIRKGVRKTDREDVTRTLSEEILVGLAQELVCVMYHTGTRLGFRPNEYWASY